MTKGSQQFPVLDATFQTRFFSDGWVNGWADKQWMDGRMDG